MIAKEVIKEYLGTLAEQFPSVQIKYAYTDSIQMHIIELTPQEQYYKNEKLDAAWIPFSLEFKNQFESEDISFISSDSSLRITNPEFEWNTELHLNIELYNKLLGISNDVLIDGIEFPTLLEQSTQVREFSFWMGSNTVITTTQIFGKRNIPTAFSFPSMERESCEVPFSEIPEAA